MPPVIARAVGQGFEKPLGTNVAQGPPGAPMAVLDSESAAWPKESGKQAGWQFRGYSLDEKRRPTFRYSWKGIDVEDFPVAVPWEIWIAGFRRTVTASTLPNPFRSSISVPRSGIRYKRRTARSSLTKSSNSSLRA